MIITLSVYAKLYSVKKFFIPGGTNAMGQTTKIVYGNGARTEPGQVSASRQFKYQTLTILIQIIN